MESAGARLRKLRLEKGFSLEEVHKKTKIHLNILKAIEEDNLANLSPIYIKGFLKIYCQFLGVDPREYTQEYKDTRPVPVNLPKAKEKIEKPEPAQNKPVQKPQETKPPAVKVNIFNPWLIRRIAVAVFALLAVFFLFLGIKKIAVMISKHMGQRKKVTVTSPPPHSIPAKTVKKAASARKSTAKPVSVSLPQSAPVSAPQTAPAQPVASAASYAEPAKKETFSGIRLGIHAKDDCWVQLKADGKAVFQNVLKKGRFEVWQAKDKMELTLGNVGNVELELNGKILPPLGKKGQAVKNILVTREGLKVER
ncbi:MAG: DUF4115 domain-containing protein [Candidatus Omnitrophica bacterium]|nr:DUF4115 domain-containing protein [Candidatus Omnitrophota bacterium]